MIFISLIYIFFIFDFFILPVHIYMHHGFHGYNVHLILMNFYAETINCACGCTMNINEVDKAKMIVVL